MTIVRIVGAHGALLFATLSFSCWNVLAGSFDTRGANTLILCLIKDLIAFLALSCCWAIRLIIRALSNLDPLGEECHAREGSPRSCRDWLLLATVGLSAPFLASLLTVLCAAWAGSDTVGILNALGPAVASALAVCVGLERISCRLSGGIALGTAGGLLTVHSRSSGASHLSPTMIAGLIAGFVMALSQGIFFVAMKPLLWASPLRNGIPSFAVIRIAYGFATAASVSCCLAVIFVNGLYTTFANWGMNETWMAVFAGFICGALNYFLITWANGILPVTICALYGVLQTPFTAIIAFVAKAEALDTIGYVSMVLVVSSVVIVSWERSTADASQGHSTQGPREELLTC